MKNLDNILYHREYKGYVEIDWAKLDVLALNLSTMQFENVSGFDGRTLISLNIYNNSADFSEDIAEKAKEFNATFLLYTYDHWCVGFVEEEEKSFDITDFIINKDDESLGHIIQWWEENRGAEAEESVFFLNNKDDFAFLVKKYDINTAILLHESYKCVLDGLSFDKPLTLNNEKLFRFVYNEFTEEYINKLIDNGTIDGLKDYLDVNGIRKYFKK